MTYLKGVIRSLSMLEEKAQLQSSGCDERQPDRDYVRPDSSGCDEARRAQADSDGGHSESEQGA